MNNDTTSGTLTAIPPFDFAKSLTFLGVFTPAMGEQQIGDQSVTKAVRIMGKTIGFRVESISTIDAPALEYTLYANDPITDDLHEAMRDRITHWLSLNDDLLPFYALAKGDESFKPVLDQLYGYHQVKFLTPFENVCWAMLSSRNTFSAARTLKNRLMESYGDHIEVNGQDYPAFPEAEELLHASPADLGSLLRQDQRGNYIWSAAQAFASVDEDWLRTGDYDEVYEWLRGIKGVGEWTASFVMIRSLGHMERLIAPEKRLLESTAEVYGYPMDVDRLMELSERYEGYKAYWSHYLRAAA